MRPPAAPNLEALALAAIAAHDYAAAEAYCDQLDAARAARPRASLEGAAHWYADHGLHVFQLQPRSKQPMRGTHGCKDATADHATIARWWQRWPDANVAIATGHLVDVIDIDGPTGVRSWAKMENLPPVLGVVSTPRAGGSHLYIAARPERTNRAALVPGIDIRGSGGYVVAPPSVNAEGVGYTWRCPLAVDKHVDNRQVAA